LWFSKILPADVGLAVAIGMSAHGLIPDTMIFPERRILLNRTKAVLPVGRASKIASKGFVANIDSAWFDNQVMSRNHAEIIADFEAKVCSIPVAEPKLFQTNASLPTSRQSRSKTAARCTGHT
jgi:hypothetical protein